MLTSSLEGFYLFILLVENVKMLEDLSAMYIESYTPLLLIDLLCLMPVKVSVNSFFVHF